MDRVTPSIRAGGSLNVGWMSPDGSTLYSAVGTTGLYTSADDGLTWTFRHTFSGGVTSVRELDNGELLVGVSVSPGELWLSDGWATGSATWAKALTASAAPNRFQNQWNLSAYGNLVFATEYGVVKDGVSNARYCWKSTDYGATWEIVFDLGLAVEIHIHGVAYDPWWSRLWITSGDATSRWYYSDDLGATWTTMAGVPKCVTILPMPEAVLFLSDGPPNGISRIVRGDKMAPVVDTGHAIDASEATNYLGTTAFWSGNDGEPAVLAFIADAIAMPGRVITTLDGLTFSEIWNDTISYIGKGMTTCVGPTRLGSYVGALDDGRQAAMSRWYAMPDTRSWLTGTGGADGATGDGNRDVYALLDGSLTLAGESYVVKSAVHAISPPATGLVF